MAVSASSRGFSSRPRLSSGAAMRRASMGGAFAAAASRRTVDGRAGIVRAVRQVLRESPRAPRLRQAAMQEQVSDFFETGVRRQIFHRIPGKRQLPGLAIHVAQPRGGGHDAFQTLVHAFMFGQAHYIVNIDCRINIMDADRYYLTAQQAADALGVTQATLYAYTSRGQLRSEPVPGRPRERRYYREDIERLRERKETRRDPGQGGRARTALGQPGARVGHHAHSRMAGLYYRGQDAVKLAETASLEQVAELLWAAEAGERERLVRADHSALSPGQLARLRTCAEGSADLAAGGAARGWSGGPGVLRSAPGGGPPDRSAHSSAVDDDRSAGRVADVRFTWPCRRHGRPKRPAAGERDSNGLVLCADHELNVSAFAARCAASAGASPYDVVSAAMATLKGRRHGGATERVSALFAEAETPRRAPDRGGESVAPRRAHAGIRPSSLPGGRSARGAAAALGRGQRKRAGVAAGSKPREGGIGVAARSSQSGFRVGGSGTNVRLAGARSAAPVRAGPDGGLDRARDRAVRRRRFDSSTRPLYGPVACISNQLIKPGGGFFTKFLQLHNHPKRPPP